MRLLRDPGWLERTPLTNGPFYPPELLFVFALGDHHGTYRVTVRLSCNGASRPILFPKGETRAKGEGLEKKSVGAWPTPRRTFDIGNVFAKRILQKLG